MKMLPPIAALLAGGIIGAGFGLVQEAARRRNQRRQDVGRLNNVWTVMPGSGVRVFYLLIALVLIQIGCPLLFSDAVKWWVSTGVAVGYGAILFRNLRQRRMQK